MVRHKHKWSFSHENYWYFATCNCGKEKATEKYDDYKKWKLYTKEEQ